MEVLVNLEGSKARVLAESIASYLGCEGCIKYLPRPFLGYVIGEGCEAFTAHSSWNDILDGGFVFLSCQGRLLLSDVMVGSSWYYSVSDAVSASGYSCEVTIPAAGPAAGAEFSSAPEPARLEIAVPVLSGVARDNFLNLLDSKRSLICAALGASDIPVYEEGEFMRLPWFEFGAGSSERTQAFLQFVCCLTAYASKVKRVSPVEHPAPNKKYAFRCFLLRIGMIGKEFTLARKLLLEKLEGNSAWLCAPEK